jgi:pseudouridine-5'-phosphate glycosidase
LPELSRTPVAVISAGVKSILDIPKTLEFLETMGVPVISYGSDYFPDFFTSNSGIKSVFRVDTPEECA